MTQTPGTGSETDSAEPVVLIVEDSVLVAMAIEDALIDRDVQVVMASSLKAARECLASCRPAVALLDLQLPDGLSLDLAQGLHNDGCTVAITSGLDSGSVPDSHRFAVQFRKPTSPDLLADWVVSTLKTADGTQPPQIPSCSPPGTG